MGTDDEAFVALNCDEVTAQKELDRIAQESQVTGGMLDLAAIREDQ